MATLSTCSKSAQKKKLVASLHKKTDSSSLQSVPILLVICIALLFSRERLPKHDSDFKQNDTNPPVRILHNKSQPETLFNVDILREYAAQL